MELPLADASPTLRILVWRSFRWLRHLSHCSPLFFLPPFSSLQCNNDYAPVCGSNNQNYQNECFLRRDACKQQSEVLIMSEGACPAGTYVYIMAPTLVHSWMHALAGAPIPPPRGIYICTERILKKVTRIEHFLHISLRAHG